jgi:hypothetical protein
VDEEHITGPYGRERQVVVISYVSGGVIDHQRFIH